MNCEPCALHEVKDCFYCAGIREPEPHRMLDVGIVIVVLIFDLGLFLRAIGL